MKSRSVDGDLLRQARGVCRAGRRRREEVVDDAWLRSSLKQGGESRRLKVQIQTENLLPSRRESEGHNCQGRAPADAALEGEEGKQLRRGIDERPRRIGAR